MAEVGRMSERAPLGNLWLRTRDDPGETEPTFVERDGKLYRLIVLGDTAPPATRSPKTRFRFRDVGKPGDLEQDKPKARKRRRAS